jgi:hypothetical protein
MAVRSTPREGKSPRARRIAAQSHPTTQTIHNESERVHQQLANLQIDAAKHSVKSRVKNKT